VTDFIFDDFARSTLGGAENSVGYSPLTSRQMAASRNGSFNRFDLSTLLALPNGVINGYPASAVTKKSNQRTTHGTSFSSA
jgi:hypothetical protein